jgi:hypothetical protein
MGAQVSGRFSGDALSWPIAGPAGECAAGPRGFYAQLVFNLAGT